MGAAQSDSGRGGNDFGGKGRRDGRRNERGERGQDRFRGERNGEDVYKRQTFSSPRISN